MNLKLIQKQLRYELKQNPKRAAALGVLLLIGVWFWAPLIGGMFQSKAKRGGSAAPPVAVAPATAAPGVPLAATESANDGWRNWAAWIDRRRRATADFDPRRLGRNPFQVEAEPEVVEPDTIAKETKPEAQTVQASTEPEATPRSRGLTLGGTMVGGRRRLALIAGRVYAEGAEVEAGNGISFRVQKVLPGAAVLERNGKEYELTVPQVTLSDPPRGTE